MLTVNPLIALLDPDEPAISDDFNTIWHAYASPAPYGCASYYIRTARLFPSFAATVLAMTGETIVRCNDCTSVVLEHEAADYPGYPVCESCQEDYYTCDDCFITVHRDDTQFLDGFDRIVCDSCYGSYSWCEYCETHSIGPCEECSAGCDCCPARPSFRFPANGAGTVSQDERLTLTLPKGIISEAGIAAISEAVVAALPTGLACREASERYRASTTRDTVLRDAFWQASGAHAAAEQSVHKAIESVGDEWQGKRGNYPKRLASALHKVGIKLAPATISEVGNLARQYSDDTSEYHIEFTRDLNQSADYFYHEDSCWW